MASSQSIAGGAAAPPSPEARASSPQSSIPARVTSDAPRRSSPVERSLSPPSRQEGARPSERDATNGRARSRAPSRSDHHDEDGGSEDEGENYESSMNARNGTPTASDEFVLTSVPLDTWVGRYVRITTPRHNGQTGLVHRTGNGWVNLQTSGGEVAKRAYNLVVIPESRADIQPTALDDKAESACRGKRYRGPKDPASMEGGSLSEEERKSGARGRSSRTHAATADSSSDSSGQDDDNEDDGDEPGNGRLPARRRGRGGAGGSDYDDPDDPDDDEEDDADDDADSRFDHDSRMRGSMRGKPFPSSKHNRAMMKNAHGGDGSRDRFGGGEMGVGKDGGRSSGKMSGRYVGHDKGRARGKSEQDKARERGRGSVDQSRGGKGDNFMPGGKAKGGDADQGGSRTKRKDFSNALGAAGDSDDKLGSGSLCREKDRGDRFKDKSGAGGSKKDEGMKNSWLSQIAKAKDRPNLVHWREELLPTTKDSSEDFEDATLSVELMKARCDVCYHEQADGDKFCWNDRCWRSPVFFGYFKQGRYGSGPSMENGSPIAPPSTQSTERSGYINTFGRETIIDSALTSALQAPVKWLETKRKRSFENHEVFSEDPALYRWQCWASNFPDPNSKDPTYVDDGRQTSSKRAKSSQHRHMSRPTSPGSSRSDRRAYDHDGGSRMHMNGDGQEELEHSVKGDMRRKHNRAARVASPDACGVDPMDMGENIQRQGGSGHARRGWN